MLYYGEINPYSLNHRGLNSVIYSTTTTIMKTTRKLAILESLDAMDHTQMEKVMDYIREILNQSPRRFDRKKRQQAMEQIRTALQPQQTLQPRF
jgi:4-alpha-glucanotransferase